MITRTPSGFEPLSPAPKASMLGHYTTGLHLRMAAPNTKGTPSGTESAADGIAPLGTQPGVLGGEGGVDGRWSPPRQGTRCESDYLLARVSSSMRRNKILATVGPASASAAVLARMLRAGVNGFRLNFSHGQDEEHRRTLRTWTGDPEGEPPVATAADLQGPKIRLRIGRSPTTRSSRGIGGPSTPLVRWAAWAGPRSRSRGR